MFTSKISNNGFLKIWRQVYMIKWGEYNETWYRSIYGNKNPLNISLIEQLVWSRIKKRSKGINKLGHKIVKCDMKVCIVALKNLEKNE